MQYHSKATDTVCSMKLKREEFLYIRTIFNFQGECVLFYMLLFYQISAWVFLIHMFLYAGFYCNTPGQCKVTFTALSSRRGKLAASISLSLETDSVMESKACVLQIKFEF